MVVMNTLENVFLTAPIVYTSYHLQQFYTRIGKQKVLDDLEKQADLFTWLFLFSPLLVGCLGLLQIPLYWLYQREGHPWKKIVKIFNEEVMNQLKHLLCLIPQLFSRKLSRRITSLTQAPLRLKTTAMRK